MKTCKQLLCLTLVACWATWGNAFEVDRLKNGMSVSELSEFAANSKLEFWQSDVRNAFIGRRSKFFVKWGLTICDGQLVGVNEPLDPDSEYTNLVEAAINRLGQPRIEVFRGPWTGPGGGDITSVTMVWSKGLERMSQPDPRGTNRQR